MKTTKTTTRTQTAADFRIHVSPGRGDDGKVFCTISFKDGKLSITGVEGPKNNGNCKGSCGQILGAVKSITHPTWDQEQIDKFLKIWDSWHLNDMNAGCVHQRANWDTSEMLEIVTYKLTGKACSDVRAAKNRINKLVIADRDSEIDKHDRLLMGLPYFGRSAPDADSFASGMYEVDKRETKSAGWVRPEEHPRGLMCKPCEVCGYEYGTEWLREEVPADVLEWLQALPQNTGMPLCWLRD